MYMGRELYGVQPCSPRHSAAAAHKPGPRADARMHACMHGRAQQPTPAGLPATPAQGDASGFANILGNTASSPGCTAGAHGGAHGPSSSEAEPLEEPELLLLPASGSEPLPFSHSDDRCPLALVAGGRVARGARAAPAAGVGLGAAALLLQRCQAPTHLPQPLLRLLHGLRLDALLCQAERLLRAGLAPLSHLLLARLRVPLQPRLGLL
mmetsp:Transcript_64302/g.203257  ORF Transcript_64302/g.203257 Transcript_64302/m.203257 type:complete len:209 (-) Transcript_64302:1428-2054(-)